MVRMLRTLRRKVAQEIVPTTKRPGQMSLSNPLPDFPRESTALFPRWKVNKGITWLLGISFVLFSTKAWIRVPGLRPEIE